MKDDQLQQVVGERYRVEREVGRGGMAAVYLAQDLKHDRPVAIKVLRPELTVALGPERFMRETRIAARLQHPHIVPVYDSGTADGVFYYVMPFVEGESLRELLSREGQLSPDRACEIASEVASALQYAHEHDLVHRDIKPENIMLSGGNAVVTDFGIALAINAAGAEKLTGTGFAVGTPAYMSPEQALGEEQIDGRSDIYSLGCVLYEMLAGKPPFSGANFQAVLAQSLTGERPSVRAQRRDVPPAIDSAITRALAHDPAERFSTPLEFSRALMGKVSRSFFSHRVRLPVVAGAAAALAVLGLGAWWMIRPEPTVVPGAETIAVVPFTTSGTGIEFLHEGMMDLLSRNLDAVGGIHVVDPRTVLHRWKKRAAGNDLDRATALEVGRSSGAGAVLLGNVVAAGRTVRMSADLAATDGTLLARATADGSADSVLTLVDTLSVRLLREVWRARGPLPSVHLSGITTGSLDAIRAYLVGEQFYRRSEWDSAIVAFRRAVQIDSTFALAYYRLAVAHGWIEGLGTAEARNAAEAAVRHANQLPARERSLLAAHELFEQARAAARDTMLAYVVRYPGDAEGWHLLGDIQFHGQTIYGRPADETFAALSKSAELDPSFTPAYEHIIDLGLMVGDSARFYWALNSFDSAGRAPETAIYRAAGTARFRTSDSLPALLVRAFHQRPVVASVIIGSMVRDRNASIETLVRALDSAARLIPRTDPRRPLALNQQAMLLYALGRLEEGRNVSASIGADNREMAAGGMMLPILVGTAPASYTRSVTEELKDLIQSPALLARPDIRYWRTVEMLAQNDLPRARESIRQARTARIDTINAPPMGPLWSGLEGWLTLNQGDTAAAIRMLQKAVTDAGYSPLTVTFTTPLRFRLAAALAARPATRDDGINRLRSTLGVDGTYRALGLWATAEALEAKGDRSGAALAYSDFVRLWEKADPELQTRVRAAREALQRLTAEPR